MLLNAHEYNIFVTIIKNLKNGGLVLGGLKGLSSEMEGGIKVVSIDRPPFKY